jgi:hypothetical protein
MTITIKRSGGYAGVEHVLATVDSSKLTGEQDARVRSLIARLSGLMANRGITEGSDRFEYEVTVTGNGEGTKSVTVIDEGNPQDQAMQIVTELIGLGSG